ncbi:hypothetical protein JCM10207_001890 [Rhodosporidiobolus poonsookiae]
MPVRSKVGAFFRKHFLPNATSSPAASAPSSQDGHAATPAQGRTSAASTPPISRRSTNYGVPVNVEVPAVNLRNSKDPGEEEMSLFRSEIDLTLDPYAEEPEEESDAESESDVEDDEDDDRSRDPSVRPSFDVSTEASHAGEHLVPPPPLPVDFAGTRPRSASAPLASHLTAPTGASPTTGHLHPLARFVSHSPGSTSPFASRSGLIDLPPNNLEAASLPSPPGSPLTPVSTRGSVGGSGNPPVALRRTWGYGSAHRASQSSPSNTLAAPSPSTSPSASGIGLGRPRSSTLQRMLASRNASSSSLGTSPGAGGVTGRSPYGQLGGDASASMRRLASGSSTSVNKAEIGAPLPNSFVHSSFVFPRSGPTPQQVAFISSRDSLGAFGYGAGVASPPFSSPPTFEAATSSTDLSAPALERPQGRGRSASSASRISSSPLARVDTLTPPPSPTRARAPALVMPTPPPMQPQEEDEPKETWHGPAQPLSPPSLPPLAPSTAAEPAPAPAGTAAPPTLPSLNLSLSSLPRLPSFSTPSASPIESGLSTAVPPTARPTISATPASPPPAIVTLAPTPTASAAPSPLLPPFAREGEGEGGEYFRFPPELKARAEGERAALGEEAEGARATREEVPREVEPLTA